MTIDWAALGIVAVVSVAMTLVFVLLLSGGIRLLTTGPTPPARVGAGGRRNASSSRLGGYALLALAGLFVLFGIYLILPFPH